MTIEKLEPLRRDDVTIIKRGSYWMIACAATGYEAIALRFRTKVGADAWLATDQSVWPEDAIHY
jgi:hypothetical protein